MNSSHRSWPGLVLVVIMLLLGACGPKDEGDFFKKAEESVEKAHFELATRTLREYLIKFPDGSERDRALFTTGQILYYHLDQKAQGVKEFLQLIKNYPMSPYAVKAREIMAAAFRDEAQDYQRAIIEYKYILSQQADSPQADDYRFQIARCFLLAGNVEEAIIEFGRLLEAYPQSNLRERVYDELGSAHLILGRPDQALFIFHSFIKKFPESPLRTAVEFKIGNALEENQRLNEALQIYGRLVDRYQNKRAVMIRMSGIKERQKKLPGSSSVAKAPAAPVLKVKPETGSETTPPEKKAPAKSVDKTEKTKKDRKAELTEDKPKKKKGGSDERRRKVEKN